jgi:[ribosomal protein S18]-alanine N-acetyltransferase
VTNAGDAIQIRIRAMTLVDVPRVREIDVLSFSLPWSERSYRFEVVENLSSSNWVAEAKISDGHLVVVGMMVNWVILDELHIATIAVHPDYRKMGLGSRLLAQGLLAGKKAGVRVAFLEVRRGNLAAQAMYAKFGFVIVGVRAHYYKDNHEDALLMNLERLDLVDAAGLEQLVGLAGEDAFNSAGGK